MDDRELRVALEAAQHETRVLSQELTLSETPGFAEQKASLEQELSPVEARASELAAQLPSSESRLVDALKANAAMESALHGREQQQAPWSLLAVALAGFLVLGLMLLPEQFPWVAAFSGLGLGWMAAMRAVGLWSRSAGKAPIAARPPRRVGPVLGLFLLFGWPLVWALRDTTQPTDLRHLVLRALTACGVVVLVGLGTRRGRPSALVAAAALLNSGIAVFGALSFPPTSGDALDGPLAALINVAVLPFTVSGLFGTQASRGHVAWRYVSGALGVAAAWSTALLTSAFFRSTPFDFVPFAALSLQLSVAAGFFAAASPAGSVRRALIAGAAITGGWAATTFGALMSRFTG